AAIAASGGSSPSPNAFLDSVAQHLGISTKKLEDATKAAAIDQVDAALAQGRITKAQADELKSRIEAGKMPLFGGLLFLGGRLRELHEHGDRLSAAATYLGLTEAQLEAKLESGQSLAQIAKAQGKSVDGLENAILAAAKKRLDQAVADGVLTQAQADELYNRLKSRIDDIVTHSPEDLHPGFRFGFGFRHFGGPPGLFRPNRFGGPPALFFGPAT
ncbi:MAG: hypothetical protein C5B48_15655, partial [Candidatus Rokuibacteriota bacterium]